MLLTESMKARRSCRAFAGTPVERGIVELLINAAQGVTAADGKRAVPSAHALYPLRLSLTAGQVLGVEGGVHDVVPGCAISLLRAGNVQAELAWVAIGDQPWISAAAGVLTISADFAGPTTAFADQPPYGRRGPGYVYIEAGGVAQSVALQAAALGLGCVLVAGFADDATAEILGLPAPFSPVLHLCFGWPA